MTSSRHLSSDDEILRGRLRSLQIPGRCSLPLAGWSDGLTLSLRCASSCKMVSLTDRRPRARPGIKERDFCPFFSEPSHGDRRTLVGTPQPLRLQS